MNRRDALQAFAALAATPLASAGSLEKLVEAGHAVRRAGSGKGPAPRALSASQARSIGALAEIIIPATDTPGARPAGVTEFIDTLLADWMPEDERNAFLAGLEMLEARARRELGAAFAECSEDQQVELATALDAEVAALLAADRAAPYDAYDEEHRPERTAPGHFFYQMKRWTLVGYYTSEVGMTQELRYDFLPGEWDPCRVLEESR
ncbi:MAG TPA: gluconate 2-dehydrogenase subunit 3 family protein [Acidobacteriota bacterium]|nr:gluconate 2-dehydrogenase subunit 3 family protein [Acidobacteriota bacterium]